MRRQPLLVLPVRRRLAALACAHLAGIYAARWACLPLGIAALIGVPLGLWGMLRLRRRKRALLCAMMCMALLGNAAVGVQLACPDAPTPGKVRLSGVVSAIEREHRVYLRDVWVEDGTQPALPVLVTLMETEDAPREAVYVGQRVSGVGRLFAQERVRNPGGIDRYTQALCAGYALSGYVLPGWTAEGTPVFSLRETIRRVREALLAHIARVFGANAPLFQGILLGSRDEMDAQALAAMRMTGTIHLLTVSGMHLSLVVSLVAALLRRMPLGRYGQLAAQTAAALSFAALTGFAPGTMRALIMTSLRALARCRGKRYDGLTALAVASLVMTLGNPLLAWQASFQLSFFIVLGMQLLGGRVRDALMHCVPLCARLPELTSMLAVTLSAQLAALPILLRFYGYVPLCSLPMNLLCGLLMPPLMLGGALGVAAGAVWLPLGRIVSAPVGALGAGFAWVCDRVAALPGSAVRLPAPQAVLLFGVIVAMALAGRAVPFGLERRRALALVLGVLALAYAARFDPRARYVQLDVGQGDAAILRAGRHALLVDVGPGGSYAALHYLRSEGLRVDAVCLSHLDEDHAGALGVLLASEVRVGCIVLPAGESEADAAPIIARALALAREQGVPIARVQAGFTLQAGGAQVQVIAPRDADATGNESSLVLLCRAADKALLLTGDLPIDAEGDDVPDCDLLKVAHHGSKYATSWAFLCASTPEVALISVGANGYGHPTQRVLNDLAAIGAAVYRTDQSGCLTVWLDGASLRVQPFVSPT